MVEQPFSEGYREVGAPSLLAAFLTTGALSDAFGRRPVMLGALAGLAGAAVLFRLADGVAALYAGRLLHGVATGVATSALSAWLLGSWAGVDLRPCIHDSMQGLAIALPGALACPSSSSRI